MKHDNYKTTTMPTTASITVFTQILLSPHHAGFGAWQAGEACISPENSWVRQSDLVAEIAQNCAEVLPIDEALLNADFRSAGVESISGRTHGRCGDIFAGLSYDGELFYFGIRSDDVPFDFYGAEVVS